MFDPYIDNCTVCVLPALHSCADPESFIRGGPTLTFILVDERREDQHTTKRGPLLALQ